jgi:hypothetical protein
MAFWMEEDSPCNNRIYWFSNEYTLQIGKVKLGKREKVEKMLTKNLGFCTEILELGELN